MNQAEAKAQNQAHWELMAPRWRAWWDRYGPASQPVSDHLVQQAGVATGARVLDLATGLGEPALSFAHAVGPAGQVLGLDQAAQMIASAREMAASAGLTNIRFEVQDVEALDLPDEAPFDALVSRWGLMFCTDVAATLAQARAYLKPEGRLVAAVWSRAEEVPLLDLAGRVMQQSLGLDLSRPGPGPFTLADPDHLTALLGQAGYRLLDLQKVAVTLVYDSIQQFIDDRLLISPVFEDAFRQLREDERQQYETALAEALESWREDDRIRLVNQALCVTSEPVA